MRTFHRGIPVLNGPKMGQGIIPVPPSGICPPGYIFAPFSAGGRPACYLRRGPPPAPIPSIPQSVILPPRPPPPLTLPPPIATQPGFTIPPLPPSMLPPFQPPYDPTPSVPAVPPRGPYRPPLETTPIKLPSPYGPGGAPPMSTKYEPYIPGGPIARGDDCPLDPFGRPQTRPFGPRSQCKPFEDVITGAVGTGPSGAPVVAPGFTPIGFPSGTGAVMTGTLGRPMTIRGNRTRRSTFSMNPWES